MKSAAIPKKIDRKSGAGQIVHVTIAAPPAPCTPRLRSNQNGFSMVEITVALGLVTFCLLALIGLLPIGLDSQKESMSESAAINCLEHIAGAIRESSRVPNQSDTYQAGGNFKDITWKLDGNAVEHTLNNLSLSGYPTSNVSDQRFAAYIEIFPPSLNGNRTGSALVRIAWPAQAQWDSSKSTWQNARGSLQSWVAFLPNS